MRGFLFNDIFINKMNIMNRKNKKVVRLTESDLVRIVKRVLSEQGENPQAIAQDVYNKILKAMNQSGYSWLSWIDGTDEESITRAIVDNVTSQEIYDSLLNLVQAKQKKRTVMDWISTEMAHTSGYGDKWYDDKTWRTKDSSFSGGGDLKDLMAISDTLIKFNSIEKLPVKKGNTPRHNPDL